MSLQKRLLSLLMCLAMTLSFVAPVGAEELTPVEPVVMAEDVAEENEASETPVELPEEEEAPVAEEEVVAETEEITPVEEEAEIQQQEAPVEEEPVVEAPAVEEPVKEESPKDSRTMEAATGELNITKISLDVGETANITLNGAKADDFESSSNTVATVNDSGEIVAVGAGTTKIIVTDTNDKKYTCVVDVDGVLSKEKVTIAEKKTAAITLTGAEIESVESSNTKIATVTLAGKITAVKSGSCTITIVDTVGNVYKCKVTVTTSYINRVVSNAKYVYGLIASIHCRHGNGIKSLEQLKKKKITNCNTSGSIVLQLSGMLGSGKTIGHTPLKGGNEVKKKNSVKKAIRNTERLKSGTYTIVRAGKKYSSLPSKYKKAGMVYIQDANMCISAGGGYIYSTNQSSSQMKKGRYYHTKVNNGYPFTHPILYIIVPKG